MYDKLTNVVEWDQLSLNAVEDDTDLPGSSNACPLIDWEAEDTVGVFCGKQSNRERNRALNTDDSEQTEHSDLQLPELPITYLKS